MFAHKKSFLPGVTERTEKEPHEGGHRIHTDKTEARYTKLCLMRHQDDSPFSGSTAQRLLFSYVYLLAGQDSSDASHAQDIEDGDPPTLFAF